LTTVVGFGGLMLAEHRGIFGLGLLLTLGSTMILIAALVVLPVMLRMVQQMRETRRAAREAQAVPVGSAADTIEHVGPRD
jgi:predicted RND superfamily exporter protein